MKYEYKRIDLQQQINARQEIEPGISAEYLYNDILENLGDLGWELIPLEGDWLFLGKRVKNEK